MADAKNKTQLTEASVEDFLNTVADEQQRTDSFKVVEIMQRASGEKPKLWGSGIIGFGLRHLKYESGREMDWMVVGFSPRKGKFALYLAHGFAKYDELMAKLGKHDTGKGCLYIKKLADVDEIILEDLVKSSVEHIKSNP